MEQPLRGQPLGGFLGRQGAIEHRHRQPLQSGLQYAAGLVVVGQAGLAAAAPELTAALAGDHPGQQRPLLDRLTSLNKHPADLERPEAAAGGLQIAAGRLQQFLVEVVAQVAVIGQERIGQGDPARGGGGERERTGFLQAGGAEMAPQAPFEPLLWIGATGFQRIGQVGAEAVVAHQAGHLFDQIHLTAQVDGAGGRHRDGPAFLVGRELAAEGLQGRLDRFIAEVLLAAVLSFHRAEQVVQGIAAQQQRRGGLGRAAVAPAAYASGPGQLLQHRHRPVAGGQGGLGRQPLLKAAAGLGAQGQAAGRAPHRLGFKHRRFQPDRGGGIIHGLIQASHHPGQGDRPVGVGHHQGLAIELPGFAIEGGERLPAPARPQTHRGGVGNAPGARQPVAVEGVEGLACLQHHQVGDVHNVVDRPHAGPLEALLQPRR